MLVLSYNFIFCLCLIDPVCFVHLIRSRIIMSSLVKSSLSVNYVYIALYQKMGRPMSSSQLSSSLHESKGKKRVMLQKAFFKQDSVAEGGVYGWRGGLERQDQSLKKGFFSDLAVPLTCNSYNFLLCFRYMSSKLCMITNLEK